MADNAGDSVCQRHLHGAAEARVAAGMTNYFWMVEKLFNFRVRSAPSRPNGLGDGRERC
jgi:hypothetical protein